MCSAVRLFEPDLIICPFLRERVPAEVWGRVRTIIIHPGPKGDRGPSSLDWAITDGSVPLGRHRAPGRRGDGRRPDLGNPDVPDRRRPSGQEQPLQRPRRRRRDRADRRGRGEGGRPGVRAGAVGRQAARRDRRRCGRRCEPTDRQFSWSDDTATIVRRIRAADGSPGVRTTLCDVPLAVFDAHAGPALLGEPGTVARRHHDAVLVHTGDGSVWIGQVRIVDRGVKLPAAVALAGRLGRVPRGVAAARPAGRRRLRLEGRREIGYRRDGDVGVLTLRLLQRGHVDRSVPTADRGPAPRRRAGHEGAGDPRRRRVLQRHPPQRHPRRGLPGDGGVAQHQRHRRRLPGDHRVHQPARRHVDRAAAPEPAA